MAEIAAVGLMFPEGPCLLSDGRLAVCEEFGGRIRIFDGSSMQDFVHVGGSPSGAALGSDGELYVCQNGPVQPFRPGELPATPAILRVRADGTWEPILSEVAGEKLRAPNDICFGPDGRLWFTDTGIWAGLEGPGDDGWIVTARTPAEAEVAVRPGEVFNNGLAFTPDGALIWVETVTRRVMTLRGELCTLPDGHRPDGLAIAADGRLFVATLWSNGITVVEPDGTIAEHITLDSSACPTNCAFDGSTLWITDPGDFDVPDAGRLWRVETDASGLALHAGAVYTG